MYKILITSSRRPTPNVRKFIKHLASVLPYARYQNRGKLSFPMLALQSMDLNIERLFVIRNKKGNPGYIDIYQVDYVNKSLIKLCSLDICGYSIDKIQTKDYINLQPESIIMYDETLNSIDNEEIIECIFIGFNVKIYSKVFQSRDLENMVIIDIKKIQKKGSDSNVFVYEILFKNLKEEIVGPVIRICNAKIYAKPL